MHRIQIMLHEDFWHSQLCPNFYKNDFGLDGQKRAYTANSQLSVIRLSFLMNHLQETCNLLPYVTHLGPSLLTAEPNQEGSQGWAQKMLHCLSIWFCVCVHECMYGCVGGYVRTEGVLRRWNDKPCESTLQSIAYYAN